jgi:molybdate transport system regulatory protein
MNKFEGQIEEVETHGHLSLVSVAVSKELLIKAVVIETPETAQYLKSGTRIAVLFKETEVILASLDTSQISIQNRMEAEVQEIEAGKLLSRIQLRTGVGELAAVVPTESLSVLGLSTGKQVLALIKTNEVMLSEI